VLVEALVAGEFIGVGFRTFSPTSEAGVSSGLAKVLSSEKSPN
jgi:hypothetical protein|tara:strand:- start:815 stop:943 length:129 start_codon:yes stop_codon:yes gene_type:complete